VKWFAVILALFSNWAWANIGSVTEFSGTAIIKRNRETITVTNGTIVELNDRVETKTGKVKITFKDNTTVSVTENSSLVVDDFVYDPKSNAGRLNLKAAGGTVRYVSGAIAHNDPKSVNIKTPTAAISVRGTDFIMSVNEIGSSMIILMPNCEDDVKCGTGEIDVESGFKIVNMNQAFQATIVETLGAEPSPPMIVNLTNSPIGNNLQIIPPKTAGGVSIVSAARSAAEKSGYRKDQGNSDSEEQEKSATANSNSSPKNESTDIIIKPDDLEEKILATSTGIPYLYSLWKDKTEKQQIGWLYEVLSPSNKNYVNIVVPVSNRAEIIVTQNSETNSYSFGLDKPVGRIVINQTYR